MTTVSVVTPWYGHLDYANGYWDAIEAGTPDEVIIVDNGSDPPLDYPGVRLEENTGFCHACNVGLHASTSDAVLFLNNDIELDDRDWLKPILRQLGPGRLVGELCAERHTVIDGHPVPYLDGWCLAGMRDDLINLGGWDETLAEPSYYGDNLLSLRAEKAGFDLVDVRPVGLRHLGNGTSRDNLMALFASAAVNRQVWEQAVREQTEVAV
jgi:GT2 family glycosyltransferase